MKKIYLFFFAMAIVLFVGFYVLLHSRFHFSTFISYVVSVNSVTFIYYALDKLLAIYNRIRIPEVVLHVMELVGGSPMALVAQQLLWHKSTKRAYQIVFWLIVTLQIFVVYVLFYTDILKEIF